jgi:hypothetical protein
MSIPDVWIVKFEEREHWTDKVKALTEAIYGVYAFDRNSVTHCCELTPSYELRFICFVEIPKDGLTETQRETLTDYMCDGLNDQEQWTYHHVKGIDKLLETPIKRCEDRTGGYQWKSDEDTFDKVFEEILDRSGNGL